MNNVTRFISTAFAAIVLSHNSYAQNNDASIIKQLNKTWLDAIVNRDTAALSKVLASDFVLINPNGRKMSKANNLANVILPDQMVLSVNIDSVEARLLTGETGTITCWTTFVIETGGKKTTGKNCYQDVYVKRNGNWAAVSAHVTLLSMKE